MRPGPVPLPPAVRFWRKVTKTPDCWLWTGANRDSHGVFAPVRAKLVPAHRFAYEQEHGPIPREMWFVHMCGVGLCVRPDHLVVVNGRQGVADFHAESRSLANRFWPKVTKGDGCWGWKGAIHSQYGYGSVRGPHGVNITSHRASWLVAYGSIPKGMEVCHRCDNPPCTNPDHLFLGTHQDNMRDMAAKGRWGNQVRSKQQDRVA